MNEFHKTIVTERLTPVELILLAFYIICVLIIAMPTILYESLSQINQLLFAKYFKGK